MRKSVNAYMRKRERRTKTESGSGSAKGGPEGDLSINCWLWITEYVKISAYTLLFFKNWYFKIIGMEVLHGKR